MTCGREGSGMVPELWGKPLCEKVWPCLDPWDSVCLRHSFHALERPREVVGQLGELFFLLHKKGAGGGIK